MSGRPLGESTPLERALVEEIGAHGPMGFDQVVDRALYDPDHGFYATGGRAGRRGDFLTSPEVGPLFGAVLARALDRWWVELGSPDRFTVVEAGAGVGTLAGAVLAALPACAPVLQYVLVERSDALRARHGDHLDLVGDPGPGPVAEPDGEGPWVWSRARLPAGPLTGVVLANELLDNLAFALVERGSEGWREVGVDVDPTGDGLIEITFEATPEVVARAEQLAPDAAVGARIPDQRQARRWVTGALELLAPGRLVVIDYADTTASMARRPPSDWLRTYRQQRRGGPPLAGLGLQDVTCEVATDQLALVCPPARTQSQAEFLIDLGLDGLVDEGRQIWTQRAHIGDLEAIRARSRVGEGEALVDPAGLGGFAVLQWSRS